jgi:hypothetical protein
MTMAETPNFQEHLDKIDFDAELTPQEIEAIDALTNNVDEVHLKEALASTCLTVDGEKWSKSMTSLIEEFSTHVEESDGWVLKIKEWSKDTPAWITKMLTNIKNNDLAYFIQKVSNLLDYKVQKWYGEAKENVQVSADKILGRQTKRALAWLKNWIQEDIQTQDGKKEYKREKFVDKKFLDGLVKDAATTAAKNDILKKYNLQWDEKTNDFLPLNGYERVDAYGSNYAVQACSDDAPGTTTPEASAWNPTEVVDVEPFGKKTFDVMVATIQKDIIKKLGADRLWYEVYLIDKNDPSISLKLIGHGQNKSIPINLNNYQGQDGLDIPKIKQHIVDIIATEKKMLDEVKEKEKKMEDWLKSIRWKSYTLSTLFPELQWKKLQQYKTFFSKFANDAVKIDASPSYTRLSSDKKNIIFDLDQSGIWDDKHVQGITIPVEKIFDVDGNPKSDAEQLKVLADVIKYIVENKENGYV